MAIRPNQTTNLFESCWPPTRTKPRPSKPSRWNKPFPETNYPTLRWTVGLSTHGSDSGHSKTLLNRSCSPHHRRAMVFFLLFLLTSQRLVFFSTCRALMSILLLLDMQSTHVATLPSTGPFRSTLSTSSIHRQEKNKSGHFLLMHEPAVSIIWGYFFVYIDIIL